ncbi:MAG TPA: TetR/AcrR family transcriptional regulator [Bacteroidota bacterium]
MHNAHRIRRSASVNGSAKRERIIDTACSLFARKDFHTVSMDEVAYRAAIAKGTLYNYFQSKEDLYYSIIKTKLQFLLDALRHLPGHQKEPARELRAFVNLLSLLLLKQPDFFVLRRKGENRESRQVFDDCRVIEKQMKMLLRDILSRGMRSGAFRKMDCSAAADAILGVIDAFVDRTLHLKLTGEQRRSEQDKMYAIIINGIGDS